MNQIDLKKISMNELAYWSPWPARLLSIDPFEIKYKTPKSVTREFGSDKWGTLLKKIANKNDFKLADVEALEQDLDKLIPCFENNYGFYLASAKEAKERQIDLYRETLSPHVDGASSLVELGAGYGSKLIALSEISPLNKLPLFAAEYTQSGCDLISLISRITNKHIEVGRCDFNKLDLFKMDIPENAIIFTSYSVHYVPELKQQFVDFILRFKPKVVIHFEPCYEYFDNKTLHGLMCRRYMELNGYTKNIASIIQAGCLNIGAKFESEHNLFGENPFLPLSIIQWTPEY